MEKDKIITTKDSNNLRQALSIATRLRYKYYYDNLYRNITLEYKNMNVNNINILEQYYTIMFEIQKILEPKIDNVPKIISL